MADDDRTSRKGRAGRGTARKRPAAGRGRGAEAERKEKVLHTRISENLADDIFRVAEDLRVPVSNLVRNVLEDVFSVVESVTDNVGDLLEDVFSRAERAREKIHAQADKARPDAEASAGTTPAPPPAQPDLRGKFPDVVGWQPLILNQVQRCAECGHRMEEGDRAVVGLTGAGLSQTYLCPACLPG